MHLHAWYVLDKHGYQASEPFEDENKADLYRAKLDDMWPEVAPHTLLDCVSNREVTDQ